MNISSRPDEDLRSATVGAKTVRTVETRDALDAAMADVLRTCDQDKLARHLGFAHASQAAKLLDHRAALNRLAQRLGDGCADLPLDEAVDVTRVMLGHAGAAS